jgi:hypothetical protein
VNFFSALLSRLVLIVAGIVAAVPCVAQSMDSWSSPRTETSAAAAAFRTTIGSIPVSKLRLNAIDPAEIAKAKRENSSSNKRLQIGIGRDVALEAIAESAASAVFWAPVPGGIAAHWEISSPGAQSLRVGLAVRSISPGVEIRFAGTASTVVYGPFSAGEVSAGAIYWSPVLSGESGIMEIFVADGVPQPDISIARVSHLFADPADPNVERLAKDGSESCEVDLVCRAATDSTLALIGNAVAKMTFSDGLGGSTFLCTGTLLNSTETGTPYFYSANHCISTQASATTLTTHWFYDRTGCGSGTSSPSYVQLSGGATLLYNNQSADALLLRLNRTPPGGATFAGWNAGTLASGTPVTAVHHPRGDWKKVSLGNMTGFLTDLDLGGSFIRVDWTSGVTEGGSSGSGIFVGTNYQLRGGLLGGPSSCAATPSQRYDKYSRFDQIYSAIERYLNPTVPGSQIVVEYQNTANFPGSPGGHFFYSSDPAEQAAIDAGQAGAFFRTSRQFKTGGTSPVCRFYGSVTPGPNSHFFTVDAAECNALRAAQVIPRPTTIQQWNYEGISYSTTPAVVSGGVRSCPAGTQPLYRAYNNAFPLSGPRNPWDSNHRFTPVLSDIAAMVAQGWRDEGIVFCTPL